MRSGYIDIHSHILPGLDDGAPDLDKSLAMVEVAYADGIRGMIATPHYSTHFRAGGDACTAAWRRLKQEIEEQYPGFQLALGNEIFLRKNDVLEELASGEIHTMAGSRYVLVEFSPEESLAQMERQLGTLVNAGYWPILAHCERYLELWKQKGKPEEFSERFYLQVNADAVIGEKGFSAKRHIKKMLKAERIHFVATDAHGVGHRPPHMRQCAEWVEKKFGQAYAERLFFRNALAILQNEKI